MLKIVWHNIKNRPASSLAIIAVVMMITSALFLGLQLTSYLEEDLDRQQLRLGADFMLIPNQVNHSRQSTMVLTPFLNIYFPKEEGLQQADLLKDKVYLAFQFYLQSTVLPNQEGNWHLVGTEWEQDFVLKSWHHDFASLDLSPGKMLVGADWVGEIGQGFELSGEEFIVAGILPTTGTEIDRTVYLSLEEAWDLAEKIPQLTELWQVREWGGYSSPQGLVSAILVKSKADGDIYLLQDLHSQEGPAKPETGSTVIEATKGHLSLLTNVFYVFGFLLWLISLGLLIIRFTARLFERKQEMGMLIALGAQKKHLYQMLLLEAGTLAGLGVLLGSLAGLMIWLIVGSIYFGNTFYFTAYSGWILARELIASVLVAILAPMVAVIFPLLNFSKWEAAILLNQREI
ncbi:MAG: ABC transporter permease [Bacillota bacterium]|nr:ABC transporter permease [Bacillota bacterium]